MLAKISDETIRGSDDATHVLVTTDLLSVSWSEAKHVATYG